MPVSVTVHLLHGMQRRAIISRFMWNISIASESQWISLVVDLEASIVFDGRSTRL